jgi:hypothetical protein
MPETDRLARVHDNLTSFDENADLVGVRCKVVFPITDELWSGKIIRNNGNRNFTWVSDNEKLACTVAYSDQFRDWTATCFMNLEGLSKVEF